MAIFSRNNKTKYGPFEKKSRLGPRPPRWCSNCAAALNIELCAQAQKFKARHVYSDEQHATCTPSLLAAARSAFKLEYNCGLWLEAAVTAGSFF
jgi:hypothetical protein